MGGERALTVAQLVEFRGPAEVEISLPAHFWPPENSNEETERELKRLVDHYVVGFEAENPDGSLVGVAHRLMEGLRLKRERKAVTPVIGGYGTGKSYLSLMVAVLLSRSVGDPLVEELLTKMRRAIGDKPDGLVEDVRRWIEERQRPYLVVPLVFDRDAAISLFNHVVDGVEEAVERWPGRPDLEAAGLQLKRKEAGSQIELWRREATHVFDAVDGWLTRERKYSLEDLAHDLEDPSRADEALRLLSKAYEEVHRSRLPLVGISGIEPFLEKVIDAYAYGEGAPFEGVVILLDEFHHYLDVQAQRLSSSDPGSRLDLQEFAGAVHRRAESLGLLLLSPTGLVSAIDQVIARIPEGDAAGDLRRFKGRLGGEVRLTYRHFLEVATSFLRHREAWDSFIEQHREELDGHARWLLDRLPSECEGMSDLKEVRARLVEGVYPLHPLAALLLCRYLVNKLEQNRTLGKMFVPEDGELASWAKHTPVLRDGKLQWFTALDVIRSYHDSLTDRRFLDTWREAETALANALPDAGDKDQDTLMAVALIEGLPLPWPATEDMLARITGWSEEDIRESLNVLLAEGIVTKTVQGWYRLDIGRRKTRLRYEEELEKALKERPATSNRHPADWLNEHLTKYLSWMRPANVGLPSPSTGANSGDSDLVQPEAFLRQQEIINDRNAIRYWAWRLEYVSVSKLNTSYLTEKIKKSLKVDSERGGFVLRVLPTNDTELTQARQQLDKILQELEGTELSKRFVIVCPEAPVQIIEALEKLYIYGKQWESNGLSQEFTDLIKEDRQDAIQELQGALEEAYTSPNARWEAPGVQIMVDRARNILREHEVVSQILAQRFYSAPPMPQVLNKPSLDELIPPLLRGDIAQLIWNKKKGAKARLIAEQVIKSAWQVLDSNNSLCLPPQDTNISAAYQLLDSLWTNIDGGKQMLRWSDVAVLFKEPYGYGENDTWRLLIACYLGWRMKPGGRLESIVRRGSLDSVAVRLRKGEDVSDVGQIIEYFTTLAGIGVRWTPPELLETEEAPAPVEKPPAPPTGSGIKTPSVGPQAEPGKTTVLKPGQVREPVGPSAPPPTSAVERILDQFDTLDQEDKVQAVDAMYRKLPKDVQEKQLEAWMY